RVVVFSSWGGDVLAELHAAVESELFEGAKGERGNGPLGDALARWREELGIDLFLILDQAEEYFVYHGAEGDEGSFVGQFPELLRAGLRVNCLVALREESLAALDVFRGKIPNLLANRLRLEHLDHDAGLAAVVQDARGPRGRRGGDRRARAGLQRARGQGPRGRRRAGARRGSPRAGRGRRDRARTFPPPSR